MNEAQYSTFWIQTSILDLHLLCLNLHKPLSCAFSNRLKDKCLICLQSVWINHAEHVKFPEKVLIIRCCRSPALFYSFIDSHFIPAPSARGWTWPVMSAFLANLNDRIWHYCISICPELFELLRRKARGNSRKIQLLSPEIAATLVNINITTNTQKPTPVNKITIRLPLCQESLD